jgi:hypothetical protein
MYFEEFEDNAHIWIYGFDRTLTESELQLVDTMFGEFVLSWKSHGNPVNGKYLLMHNRFVILAVSKESYVSGCSIDSSVRIFKHLKETSNLDGLDMNLVFYRSGDQIRSTGRLEFQDLIDQGEVSSDTMVFDTTIHTVGTLRAGKFEQPVSESWHSRYFSLSA